MGYFGSAHSLHYCLLKSCAYCHDLSGRLHLGAEKPFGVYKFVKRPLGHFDNNIVKCGFKACAGLSGDSVCYLVQGVSYCYLGGDLGNRVSGCF